MQLLTANFNMLTSSKLLCTQEETNYQFQCTNHVYFSYFKNDGNASFVVGILKAMPSTFFTIGSNIDIPGTPYMIINCEIDIDA